jgi:VWFA-related protein
MGAVQAMKTRCAVLSLFVAGGGVVHSQPPTFSSRVDAVRVDVLVTDGRGPVRGLGPADFEIRDNGVLQQVDLVSFDQIPLNVVLSLDMSASVAGDRLDRLRSAGAAILGNLKPGDQAALVTFSHVVRLAARMSTDIASVRTALLRANGDGATSLTDGVYTGIIAGQADAGRELLIVFSDGLDTSSWLPTHRVLDVAKRSDVVSYAVAVRSPARPEFLRDLTSFTGGRLFEVEKTENLDAVFVGILEEFRQRYLVSYTPRGVPREGWHKLDVRVKRAATVKARPGYQS